MPRDHGENFFTQPHHEIGLTEFAALMRQQYLQPLACDSRRGIAVGKEPQQAHAALRPSSLLISPLRSLGTAIATVSPSSRRVASM